MDLKEQIYSSNPHWEGEAYTYPFTRPHLEKIIKARKSKLICTLIGPRRVGKTVLMRQCMQRLIEAGTDKRRILYFSFEDKAVEPFAAIKKWGEELSLDLRKGEYHAYFDEIQNVRGWAPKIKILYDNYPNFSFTLSGSASAKIRRGKESLAGRELEIHVNPLSFAEYLKMAGKSPVSPASRWEHYLAYMKRQLPDLALKDIDPKEYVSLLVQKVIRIDVPELFDIEQPDVLDGIFRSICKSPGQIIKAESLAADFGINRITASKYLYALEEALLVRRVYNYSKNPIKSEKRDKKYYPYFSTLHAYTQPYAPDLAAMAETETAWQSGAEYFFRDRNNEIDFIAGTNLDIGIEVKMRNRVDASDVAFLENAPMKLAKKYVVVMAESKLSLPPSVKAVRLDDVGETFKKEVEP